MKHKTSVAIDEKLLAALKREAKGCDRSVSYLLNKMIEEKISTKVRRTAHQVTKATMMAWSGAVLAILS